MLRRLGTLTITLAFATGLGGCTSLSAMLPDEQSRANARSDKRNQELLQAQRKRNAALAEAETEPTRRSASELIREGDQMRQGGDISKAAVAYLRAHHADKNELTPLRRIAYLALEREPAQAGELFGELVEKNPDAADLHLGLAMSKLAAGDLQGALASGLRASELDPEEPVVLEAVAVIYDRLGRHEEAQAIYRSALDKAAPAPRLLNNLGVSYLITERYDEAIASFERALARGSTDPTVHNNLGLALGLSGRYDTAFSAFIKSGTPGDAYNNLGFVLFLRGDYEAAKRAYEKALLSDDTDAERVLENLKVLEQSHREGRI